MNNKHDNPKKNEKIAKRDAIIESAFKLFYTNGADDTSFEAIASDCGITAPLISYHFKTKSKLVEELANLLTYRIAKSVSEKIYINNLRYNPKVCFAANIIIIHKLLSEDEKARRFFLYFLNSGFEYNFIDGHKDYYTSLDRYYCFGLDRSNDEISLMSTSLLFSAFGLTYAFFTDRLNCTMKQMTQYMIREQFRLMHVNEEEIGGIVEEAEKLVDLLDFKFEPYFQII